MEKESEGDFEEELAKQNAIVEYFYKVSVDENYPLLKKFNQLEQLNYMFELDAKRNGLME